MPLYTILCPECLHLSTFRVEEREETYLVKGVPITVADALVIVCNDCGRAIDSDYDDDNLRRAYRRYEQQTGDRVAALEDER